MERMDDLGVVFLIFVKISKKELKNCKFFCARLLSNALIGVSLRYPGRRLVRTSQIKNNSE